MRRNRVVSGTSCTRKYDLPYRSILPLSLGLPYRPGRLQNKRTLTQYEDTATTGPPPNTEGLTALVPQLLVSKP